jgi:hypothetical protein
MSGVGFLMIVVVISVVGSIIVWLRNRQPNDPLSSVGDFQREMQALGSTPPSAVDGPFEAKPTKRVNTVQLRSNEPVATETDVSLDPDNGSSSDLGSDEDSER